MERFRCRIAQPDGTISVRTAEAADPAALQNALEHQGYIVLEIARARRSLFPERPAGGVPARALVAFSQELVELLKAGLPLVACLGLLIDRTEQRGLRAAILQVRDAVVAGSALSDALARRSDVFSPLYTASVRAGERSGHLTETLDRYVRFQTGMLDLRSRLITSLSYPAFLFIVSVAVILFLISFVLPSFSEMYGEFNAALPAPTRILLGLSLLLRNRLPFILLAFVLAAVGLRQWYRTEPGRQAGDALLLRLPFLGMIIRRYALAQFTRTLATILSGGVPLLAALRTTKDALLNRALAERLGPVLTEIQSGVPLSVALERSGFAPAVITQMIAVGEAAGSLEAMLNRAADFQEQEITTRLARMMSLLEPVLMLALGAIIGAIVIMIYLPIFTIVETIR